MDILARDLSEVQEVGRQLLPHRVDEIENGCLRGKHWYLAILEEAHQIVLDRRNVQEAA